MQRTTWYFLLAELLDIITTAVGLSLGGLEMNPLLSYVGWGNLILIKLVGILVVTIILEKKKKELTKFSMIIPWIATLFPLWNSFNLVVYWFFK